MIREWTTENATAEKTEIMNDRREQSIVNQALAVEPEITVALDQGPVSSVRIKFRDDDDITTGDERPEKHAQQSDTDPAGTPDPVDTTHGALN